MYPYINLSLYLKKSDNPRPSPPGYWGTTNLNPTLIINPDIDILNPPLHCFGYFPVRQNVWPRSHQAFLFLTREYGKLKKTFQLTVSLWWWDIFEPGKPRVALEGSSSLHRCCSEHLASSRTNDIKINFENFDPAVSLLSEVTPLSEVTLLSEILNQLTLLSLFYPKLPH